MLPPHAFRFMRTQPRKTIFKTMNIKKLFFSIAMAMGIFFHAVIRAQDKSTPIFIVGYVYDNFTGAGIKDAKITLMDKDSTVIG